MKRTLFFLSFLLILSLLAGCDSGITIDLGSQPSTSSSSSTTNSAGPVTAFIDSPANNSSFGMQPVEVNYHATAANGIATLELSLDGTVLTTTASPDLAQQYVAVKYTWTPATPGSHVLRVRAQDSKGEWSAFTQAMVTIQGEAQQVQPTTQAPAVPAATNTPQPTPTLVGVQLVSLTKSTNIFYFNATSCGPMEVTFTLKLSNPQDVKYVYLFARLFSNEGEGTSNWDGGHIMRDRGNGEYTLTLAKKDITNPSGYDRATLNYQFVAKDKGNADLLRTSVYKDVTYNSCP